MNCEIYKEENNGAWNKITEHENVNTITSGNGNIVIVLDKEDYLGKIVYLYDNKNHRAIIK